MKEFTWFMGRCYKLVDAADYISGVLGRKPVSRVSNALLAKRAHPVT